MAPDATRPTAWTCSQCGRRVPRHVNQCRCGCGRPLEPAPVAADTEDLQPAPGQARWGAWAGWAVAAVAVAYLAVTAGPFARRPAPPPPAPVETPAPVAAPAPEPASPGAAAVARSEPYPPVTAAAPVSAPPPMAPPAAATRPVEDVIADLMPAVAVVSTSRGSGSGFFISATSLLTSAHVVTGAGMVTVKLANGTTLAARVAKVDTRVDLALLSVIAPATPHPAARLGSVTTIKVGQPVIVIGSPLGTFTDTVTRGIVSAIRDVDGVRFIQTDAAINPGNSGGPVINERGEVIGVATMKYMGGESLAFAVAIDYASRLLGTDRSPTLPTPGANRGASTRSALPEPPPGKSDMEIQRDQGVVNFERAVQQLARMADQVDGYWERNASECTRPSAGAAQGDRAWFDLWDRPDAVVDSQKVGCGSWLQSMQANANRVRQGMEQAADYARRMGVYPGTQREIRRRYRMDWDGWNR